MASASTTCTRAGWASTAILALLCALAPVVVHAEEIKPGEIVQPMPEPPGTQPPDPPVFPTPLPGPEIVQPPEAPPVLIPVTVEWSIPRSDPDVSDELRFVSVWCGTQDNVYKHGRWDFMQPGTRGVVQLEGPSYCAAVVYYWHDGAYRYSDMSEAVQVDPLKPAAPELVVPIDGMETTRYVCQSGTVRCATNALQSASSARPAIRTRNCTCLLR